MNGMTIGEMLRACRGEWQGNEETLTKAPSFIVTDSRQAGEGSLFLALRGERTDGHRYIPDVLQKGALAVLCEERGAAGEPRIVVPDTLTAMQQSRKRWDIPFIGVTGSVGKTTAKEMLAAALSGKYEVFKTPGSMNGQIGIPVSLIGLHGEYDVAVIEMGVSLFGEMTRLTNMVHPDMAVFTNIGDAHLEALGDRLPGGRKSDEHRADGVAALVAVRTGNTCDADGDIRRRRPARTLGHRAGNGRGHRAVLLQHVRRNAEHAVLDDIGIAHDAAHEDARRARHIRDALGDQTAGAALRRGEGHAARLERFIAALLDSFFRHNKPSFQNLMRTNSRFVIARSMRPSISRTASASRTSSRFGFVRGWRGVKTVQQSS